MDSGPDSGQTAIVAGSFRVSRKAREVTSLAQGHACLYQ